VLEYKCPNCGGPISFDADAQQMVCPYCNSQIDVAALKQFDADLGQAQKSEALDWNYTGQDWAPGEQEGMLVYSCQSCGGEIVAEATLGATKCPFCDNPVVVTSQFSGTLRPNVVIPFKKGKDAAMAALAEHYQGKRLLPKVFKSQNHLDEIRGVYVPFWLFDADAAGRFTYKATTSRHWSDSDNIYTETSHYGVFREAGMSFDEVPADGSSKMDDTLMESIEPFDYSQAVDFQTAYLSGFLANKYDVTAEQMAGRTNDRVAASLRKAARGTVTGYETVAEESADIRLRRGEIRYALLPVWILNTSWKGKSYIFAMNGQTGRFVGDLPLDVGAFWRWALGLLFGAGAVFGALIWAFAAYSGVV
jgi:DNA-directed RNA polymerase subunit RPC12/RpoP